MEWLLLIVIVIFLGIWLWNIRQRRIAEQQQQLQEAKITEATRLVTPIVEKAYDQLTEEIRSKWLRIPFEFPVLENLLTTSRTILAGYPYQDIRRLAKRLLSSVVSKAVADFVAYTPDFVPAGENTLADVPMGFHIQDNQFQAIADGHNPPDWSKRRRLAHDRDGGCCRCEKEGRPGGGWLNPPRDWTEAEVERARQEYARTHEVN